MNTYTTKGIHWFIGIVTIKLLPYYKEHHRTETQTVLGMSKTVRIHVFTTLWPVGNVKSFQMLCDELELRRCFRPKCMASMAAVFLFSTRDHGNDY
ncbi:hypothetical protein T4B_3164 [Trichinella pseudospiralis]|uniref:Uncharacterized protein n=1 Tax=Trichinella pseudospiralis TaxID=6337 RepID=A0A0V1GUC3_TRIPS|nr:hypothetical protein T4A_6861 [Trichinella pseudospiralis]KRZ01911.1 hypothetical protein T4B_3164 [Trichinella pseudospiralis]KRZ41346.1 hypothetical protein T4C_11508 [Trichinella pseudospiralis]KRZ41368.1 hypothetical protein T4C_2967 [Trichinella pseudospiralis]KRZ41369.1 hypothetical protein T4C_2967 [Trichinella pseudospiralis]